MKNNRLCPIVVLIGGNGSNLQALIDRAQDLSLDFAGVISHRPDAYGLCRAKEANIPTVVVDHAAFPDKASFEAALSDAINTFEAKLIVLAGFMRILSADFIKQFPHPILNIHPSLLPKFKGLHTHQRALEAKETEHGVSIHFVTEELDGGPIIAQVSVPILPHDDAKMVGARVLAAEHWLYPQVIAWFVQKRLNYSENIVTLDSRRVGPQGVQLTIPTVQGIAS